jgi:membrane fusion protein (multidrug efflux system)
MVEETKIRRVKPNAPVDVHIDAFPHQTFKGHVQYVNAVTGGQFSLLPANNASGNFTKTVQRIPVKIQVDDPKHQLAPGMSAVVDIDTRP